MDDEFIEYPLDGILDLHMFQPSEAKSAVIEYITECRNRGILEIRIIHGKGTGVMRKLVHSILDKSDIIYGYKTANDESGWGATLVDIKPLEKK